MKVTYSFSFVANDRALDYINTLYFGGDVLLDYRALVAWLEAAGSLTAAEARKEVKFSATPEARATFKEGVALRALLRGVVESVTEGHAPVSADVAKLNAILRRPAGYEELRFINGTFGRVRVLDTASPRLLLSLIAEAARELFADKDMTAIRRCAGESCTRFFYDASHNRTRRWCTMAGCGNRQKVAALRTRRRAGDEHDGTLK